MNLFNVVTFFVLFMSLTSQAKWGEIKTIHRDMPSAREWNRPWLATIEREEQAIDELLRLLEKSATGKKMLVRSRKKARMQNKTLKELIRVGDHSLTDTTLVRRFSAHSPDKIHYESRSQVFINRSLSKKDALLDLAHELTHFATREAFNPYRDNFGLKEFVHNTVEGKGGEVEAYLVECQVYFELFGRDQSSHQKCHLVLDGASGRLSAHKGKEQFYRLGNYYAQFDSQVRKHELSHRDFDGMSGREALFISSAYGMPYPLAAVFEYESIMARVCHNDEKRLRYLAQERSPASVNSYKIKSEDHRRRCAKFTQR